MTNAALGLLFFEVRIVPDKTEKYVILNVCCKT